MKLATYIDGSAETPHRVMIENHSVSCSVSIKKEDQEKFKQLLEERLGEEIKLPTHGGEPVPITFSTDELSDMVSDVQDEEWIAPYVDDLVYMAEEDPCGMGIVYLMGSRT